MKTQRFSALPKGEGFFSLKKSRVLFLGTAEFACPVLEKLILHETIVGVVTQPDRPAGRGLKLQPSPVKQVALKREMSVYQPENINESSFLLKMRSLNPHFLIVVAFGQILREEFLRLPRLYPLNLHASLLPEYRGAAPIPWAIIRGEKRTGVTVQRMREKVDAGEIILQRSLPIEEEDTTGRLTGKLSFLGAELLAEAIIKIKESKVDFKIQEEKAVSYAPRIRRESGKINWQQSALVIHNLVRGLNPYPGAFSFVRLRGKREKMKIWKTRVNTEQDININQPDSFPGKVLRIDQGDRFLVATGEGSLWVKEVQLPGRKAIPGVDFIRGYHIKQGFNLAG